MNDAKKTFDKYLLDTSEMWTIWKATNQADEDYRDEITAKEWKKMEDMALFVLKYGREGRHLLQPHRQIVKDYDLPLPGDPVTLYWLPEDLYSPEAKTQTFTSDDWKECLLMLNRENLRRNAEEKVL